MSSTVCVITGVKLRHLGAAASFTADFGELSRSLAFETTAVGNTAYVYIEYAKLSSLSSPLVMSHDDIAALSTLLAKTKTQTDAYQRITAGVSKVNKFTVDAPSVQTYIDCFATPTAAVVTKAVKPRAKKDPNAPKKAQNAYMLYAADRRAVLKDTMNHKEIISKAAAEWKDLPEVEKAKYNVLYEKNKAAYIENFKAYEAGKTTSLTPQELVLDF